MIVFRSVNGFALAYFGPLFLCIPIVIYAVFKFRSKGMALPEGHASFEQRGVALGIDLGLVFALDLFLRTLFASQGQTPPFPIGLVVIVCSFANLIILPSFTGWSIGKRILKLKIVHKNDKKIGFGEIFAREMVKSWLSMSFFYLGCFWLLTKKQATWHDSFVDTTVVNT